MLFLRKERAREVKMAARRRQIGRWQRKSRSRTKGGGIIKKNKEGAHYSVVPAFCF
jgi:hypothetical protein